MVDVKNPVVSLETPEGNTFEFESDAVLSVGERAGVAQGNTVNEVISIRKDDSLGKEKADIPNVSVDAGTGNTVDDVLSFREKARTEQPIIPKHRRMASSVMDESREWVNYAVAPLKYVYEKQYHRTAWRAFRHDIYNVVEISRSLLKRSPLAALRGLFSTLFVVVFVAVGIFMSGHLQYIFYSFAETMCGASDAEMKFMERAHDCSAERSQCYKRSAGLVNYTAIRDTLTTTGESSNCPGCTSSPYFGDKPYLAPRYSFPVSLTTPGVCGLSGWTPTNISTESPYTGENAYTQFQDKLYSSGRYARTASCGRTIRVSYNTLDPELEQRSGRWPNDLVAKIGMGEVIITDFVSRRLGLKVGGWVFAYYDRYYRKRDVVTPMNSWVMGDYAYSTTKGSVIFVPYRVRAIVNDDASMRLQAHRSIGAEDDFVYVDYASTIDWTSRWVYPYRQKYIRDQMMSGGGSEKLYQYANSVIWNMPPDKRLAIHTAKDLQASYREATSHFSRGMFALGSIRHSGKYQMLIEMRLLDTVRAFRALGIGLNVGIGLVGVVICFFAVLSLHSLLSVQTEKRLYDFGILRIVGMRRRAVPVVVISTALVFAIPASVLGSALSVLLISKIILPAIASRGLAAAKLDYMGTIVTCAIFGVGLPMVSALFPMLRSLQDSLIDTLDTVRRGASALTAPIKYTTRTKRTQIGELTGRPEVLAAGTLVFAICSFMVFAAPKALLDNDLGTLFLMFVTLLSLTLVGLVVGFHNFISILERFAIRKLFFFVKRPLKQVALRNMRQHTSKNTRTSILFSLLMATTILIQNLSSSGLSSFGQLQRLSLGADLRVKFGGRGVRYFEMEGLSDYLSNTSGIAGFTFVAQGITQGHDMYPHSLSEIVGTATIQPLVIAPNYLDVAHTEFLELGEFYDYTRNVTQKPVVTGYSVLGYMMTSLFTPSSQDSHIRRLMVSQQEKAGKVVAEGMYSGIGYRGVLMGRGSAQNIYCNTGDAFKLKFGEIDRDRFKRASWGDFDSTSQVLNKLMLSMAAGADSYKSVLESVYPDDSSRTGDPGDEALDDDLLYDDASTLVTPSRSVPRNLLGKHLADLSTLSDFEDSTPPPEDVGATDTGTKDSHLSWDLFGKVGRFPGGWFWAIDNEYFKSSIVMSIPAMFQSQLPGGFRGQSGYSMDLNTISSILIRLAPEVRDDTAARTEARRQLSVFMSRSIYSRIRSSSVYDSVTVVDSIRHTGRLVEYLFAGIMVIVMAAAFFSLVASVQSNIAESQREVGIYCSMGMNKKQVLTILTLESNAVVTGGCLAGFMLGTFLSNILVMQWGMMSGLHFSLSVPAKSIIVLFVVAFFLALSATWFPARRAMRKSAAFNVKMGSYGG